MHKHERDRPPSILSKALEFLRHVYLALLGPFAALCVAAPPLMKQFMPELDFRVLVVLSVFLFLTAAVLLVLDIVLLQRRAKEPGFDPWSEI